MKRTIYLEEDLRLIHRYFPGAKLAAYRTPFDLPPTPEDPWRLRADTLGHGELSWNQ